MTCCWRDDQHQIAQVRKGAQEHNWLRLFLLDSALLLFLLDSSLLLFLLDSALLLFLLDSALLLFLLDSAILLFLLDSAILLFLLDSALRLFPASSGIRLFLLDSGLMPFSADSGIRLFRLRGRPSYSEKHLSETLSSPLPAVTPHCQQRVLEIHWTDTESRLSFNPPRYHSSLVSGDWIAWEKVVSCVEGLLLFSSPFRPTICTDSVEERGLVLEWHRQSCRGTRVTRPTMIINIPRPGLVNQDVLELRLMYSTVTGTLGLEPRETPMHISG
ncbi:hypothetical protein EYF80_041819 [Liparis tanakae]|uniref:Uncharacterized protein n=1 Tax=Liparis tanakae TaxID=230148 RepID=A0A4Z2G347_9TELE|nr:hypothetical protein EYF80_041819 [Liparis tanakae]